MPFIDVLPDCHEDDDVVFGGKRLFDLPRLRQIEHIELVRKFSIAVKDLPCGFDEVGEIIDAVNRRRPVLRHFVGNDPDVATGIKDALAAEVNAALEQTFEAKRPVAAKNGLPIRTPWRAKFFPKQFQPETLGGDQNVRL